MVPCPKRCTTLSPHIHTLLEQVSIPSLRWKSSNFFCFMVLWSLSYMTSLKSLEPGDGPVWSKHFRWCWWTERTYSSSAWTLWGATPPNFAVDTTLLPLASIRWSISPTCSQHSPILWKLTGFRPEIIMGSPTQNDSSLERLAVATSWYLFSHKYRNRTSVGHTQRKLLPAIHSRINGYGAHP